MTVDEDYAGDQRMYYISGVGTSLHKALENIHT
jgi:hypothetical protein